MTQHGRGRLLLGAFPTAKAACKFIDRVGVRPASEVDAVWALARESFLSAGDVAAKPETAVSEATLAAVEPALRDPLFLRSVEGHTWQVGSVEIESLVTPQPLVRLARVASLSRSIDDGNVHAIMFPNRSSVEAQVEAPGDAALALVTERAELGVSRIEAREGEAPGSIDVVFRLETRPNYVTVLRDGARLVVRNGNHRLVAAGRRGIRRVPCVLIDADDGLSARRPDRFSPSVLRSRRPPRIGDLVRRGGGSIDIELQPRRHVTVLRAEQHWSAGDGSRQRS